MGGSDMVSDCQATVQEMYEEYLYKGLLIWLDDLLGYEKSEEGLPKLLRGVLKCSFYLRETKWRGRVISKRGVRHDPGRIRASEFKRTRDRSVSPAICMCPRLDEDVHPRSQRAHATARGPHGDGLLGCRRTHAASGLQVPAPQSYPVGSVSVLGNAVELAHVKQDYRLSVFTDASESHRGAVITQVPRDHLARRFRNNTMNL
ncbi:hypothetical protein PHMEG_00030322 [Phytophthora megakarya]|uniref:Reverse transcriptase n=1 Tax=Phytophthora megakarya TaxID=4795 RepID=A0A225UZ01_9STRA|nr:hypothetical protein PHMEG_00030322 [Phytophthora megakarya]